MFIFKEPSWYRHKNTQNVLSVRKKSKGDIGKININDLLKRLKDELIM